MFRRCPSSIAISDSFVQFPPFNLFYLPRLLSPFPSRQPLFSPQEGGGGVNFWSNQKEILAFACTIIRPFVVGTRIRKWLKLWQPPR